MAQRESLVNFRRLFWIIFDLQPQPSASYVDVNGGVPWHVANLLQDDGGAFPFTTLLIVVIDGDYQVVGVVGGHDEISEGP